MVLVKLLSPTTEPFQPMLGIVFFAMAAELLQPRFLGGRVLLVRHLIPRWRPFLDGEYRRII